MLEYLYFMYKYRTNLSADSMIRVRDVRRTKTRIFTCLVYSDETIQFYYIRYLTRFSKQLIQKHLFVLISEFSQT